MSRFTILAVDDETSVLEILFQTFRADYTVLRTESPHEALDVLREQAVDLLITDQRMPEMRGTELVERARVIAPDVPAILLTGYTDPPDLIDAINRGQVYRFVTKPWDIHDLTQTVRTALEQVRLERENEKLAANNQRRLAALELLHDASAGPSGLQSRAEYVDSVAARIGEIVTADVVASVLRLDTKSPAVSNIRCLAAISEQSLAELQDTLSGTFAKLAGYEVPAGTLLTRVSGRVLPGPRTARISKLKTFALGDDSEVFGLIAVGSVIPEALHSDDERIIELVVGHMREVLGGLENRADRDRARMAAILDRIDDGIVMTRPQGQILVANRSARALLDPNGEAALDGSELVRRLGLDPFDLLRRIERSAGDSIRELVQLGGQTVTIDVHPLVDKGGGLDRIIFRLAAAGHNDDRRDALLSFVSHELRTPLTSVRGTLDLLLDGKLGGLSDEQLRYLRLARDASLNLGAVLDDLVDESAASEGRIELKLEPCSLGGLVSRSVQRFEAAMRHAGVDIKLASVTSPVEVLADSARLHQVLDNVLANAIKFTDPGGSVQVEVFSDPDVGESCGFSIWNSGAQLERSELESIFDHRKRGESALGVRGSGLGLSIARSIVEGHGGHIWAEDSDEDGVRFVVVLPLQGLSERDWARGFKLGSVSEITAKQKAPRILLVHSERSLAYSLKALLLSRGYLVDIAYGTDDAIQLARDRSPELVVVEVAGQESADTPLMDILRHDPETQSVPLLALCEAGNGLRVMRAGASAYLIKPIRSQGLISTVHNLISGVRDGQRVLIVDADVEFRAMCAKALSGLGFLLAEASESQAAFERAVAFRPDLIVLDLGLPGSSGFQLFRSLREEVATEQVAVIFVSSDDSTDAKVAALRMGGDDYLVKPIEAIELAARVEMVLRRREDEGASSPTTRLPGGIAIEREIARRIAAAKPFSLCYLDLDHLKAFNDHYGYAKADGVIRQTGDLLRDVLATSGGRGDFLGHIAGDDFVFIVDPGRVDTICQAIVAGFDRVIPLYYTRRDRERGYIRAEDRYGKLRHFPIMSVSIAVVTDTGSEFTSHSALASVAAELKKRAKSVEGSCVIRNDVLRQSEGLA